MVYSPNLCFNRVHLSKLHKISFNRGLVSYWFRIFLKRLCLAVFFLTLNVYLQRFTFDEFCLACTTRNIDYFDLHVAHTRQPAIAAWNVNDFYSQIPYTWLASVAAWNVNHLYRLSAQIAVATTGRINLRIGIALAWTFSAAIKCDFSITFHHKLILRPIILLFLDRLLKQEIFIGESMLFGLLDAVRYKQFELFRTYSVVRATQS